MDAYTVFGIHTRLITCNLVKSIRYTSRTRIHSNSIVVVTYMLSLKELIICPDREGSPITSILPCMSK